jgi:hypothetical protein
LKGEGETKVWLASKEEKSIAVLPERYLEGVDPSPTAHIGIVAQVAKMVLRATRRAKGQ